MPVGPSARSRDSQVRSACPPARSASTREVLVKATEYPVRHAACPRAWAMWDLPTPTGPWRTTDSPNSKNRRVERSRIRATGVFSL